MIRIEEIRFRKQLKREREENPINIQWNFCIYFATEGWK
jgi:hypothetical protein